MSMTLEEVQHACKTSLYFLCKEILKFDDWDVIHDDIEKHCVRPSKRKMLLIPRGHLKTTIVTKARTIQKLLIDPNRRILIANQVWDKAREMLYEIKELLTNKSELPKIFGRFVSERWREDDIVIAQRTKALSAPSVATTGVEAEMTSTHFDDIVLDDLQGMNNFQTQEQREKVKRFYRSMPDLLEPGGELCIIGTRWHQDDLYAHIMEQEKDYYDIMVRRVVENNRIIFPKKFNLKFDPKTKLWAHSTTHTLDYIDYLKKTKQGDFYSQYMNNPVDEEKQKFKASYFRYWTERPADLFVCMTVDPAISQKSSADYFAINVSGMDKDSNIYVLDTIKGRWAPSDAIEHIFTTYLKWKPTHVGLETAGFQKTLQYSLNDQMQRKNIYFAVTELKHVNTTKELRINALEPYFRNGKIFHAKWMKSLEDELLNFPVGRHDDEVDALASQLELLVAAEENVAKNIPVGSWEDAFQNARRHNDRYRDFFHEALNG